MKLFFAITITVFLLLSCNDKPAKKSETIIIPPPATSVTKRTKNPYVTLDQSPMDISYLPSNYPMLRMKQQDSMPLIARVIYSRPHKKGRKIFGDEAECVCKYGIPWRLGANEATEIEFFQDVKLMNTPVKKGRYIMYCIPYAEKWIIKLNTRIFSWGLHIDPSDNTATIEIPVQHQSPPVEDFTILFEELKNNKSMILVWDSVKVVVPIQL
jgi:hypothetical protein